MPEQSPRTQHKGDSRGLLFEEIKDFSPGVFSASSIAFSSPPNTIPGPFVAPLGAADASATFQCLPLPGGGLGPGPSMYVTKSMAQMGLPFPDSATSGYLVALQNTFVTQFDELVTGIETNHGVTGTGHAYSLDSILVTSSARVNIQTITNSGLTGGSGIGGSCYPFTTRVSATNPTTTVGQQVVVVPINIEVPAATGGGGVDWQGGQLILYPDPATPTVNSFKNIVPFIGALSTSTAGTTFGHQNRICALHNVAVQWPRPPTIFGNNDAIQYTDPPNSEAFGTFTDIVFVAEEPFGYGATGSVSAGELFMVKARGPGVIVSGDINNPTVTSLPGVQPTGAIYGQSAAGKDGLYYCCDQHGAWLWNGGNTALKVSAQLDDNFFRCNNPIPNQQYYSYYIHRWGDWMLFSNNYMYNTITNSWWRLFDPSTASFFWYQDSWFPNQIYGAIISLTSTSAPLLYAFNSQVPSTSWSWKSLPIRLAQDRSVDIREIVLRAASPYGGSSTFTVTVYDDDGNSVVADTVTASTIYPTTFRMNISLKSEDFAVGVSCAGTGCIYSIGIGYRTREHVGVT